jgi:hypothetical protein
MMFSIVASIVAFRSAKGRAFAERKPVISPVASVAMLNLAALLFMAVATGCSGEVLGPVTGVVTCDGEPVPGAMVLFHNDKLGVHMMARANEQGRYQVEMAKGNGLPLGEYLVCVSPPIQDHPLGPIKAPPPDVDLYPNIPRKYRDVKTSDLKIKVAESGSILDIKMHRE